MAISTIRSLRRKRETELCAAWVQPLPVIRRATRSAWMHNHARRPTATTLVGMNFAGRIVAGLTVLLLCVSVQASEPVKFSRAVELVVPDVKDSSLHRWAQNFEALGKKYLSKRLKLRLEPDNNGLAAWRRLGKAGGNGHTALLGSTFQWYRGLNNTDLSDTVGGSHVVCLLTEMQYVLVARTASSLHSWEKLVRKAREYPGKLRVVGNVEGLASVLHLARQANIELKYIEYDVSRIRGPLKRGEAELAVVQTYRFFHKRYNKIRGIAVLGDIDITERALAKSPHIVTPQMLGMTGMSFPRWVTMHGDTSEADVQRMSEAFAAMASNGRYQRMMEDFGLPLVFRPLDEARAAIERLHEQFHNLRPHLEAAGIRDPGRATGSN